MIESIKITALNKALDLPYKPEIKQDLWISVVGEEDHEKISKLGIKLHYKGVKHFAQYFYDWSDEDTEPYIATHIEMWGPKESHVNNIISFLDPYIRSTTPHNLGVNCLAGISRSTAVGVIAWVMQGKTPKEALDEILKVRPTAWPNLRILRFASARLGVDILTPISDWKRENRTRLYEG